MDAVDLHFARLLLNHGGQLFLGWYIVSFLAHQGHVCRCELVLNRRLLLFDKVESIEVSNQNVLVAIRRVGQLHDLIGFHCEAVLILLELLLDEAAHEVLALLGDVVVRILRAF